MRVAISACLLGRECRYDGTDNLNETLLAMLKGSELIPFCPEDDAFGTPRPTMDLIQTKEGIEAVCNQSGQILSLPVKRYAKEFFESHRPIDLFIGKDRSPSCGVCSARLYDEDRDLLSSSEAGLMAEEAIRLGIKAVDAENYKGDL